MASGKSKTRTQEVREHGNGERGSKRRRLGSASLCPRGIHAGCVKISAPATFTGGDQKWNSTKRAKTQPIQPLCMAGPAYAACELTSLGVNAEAGKSPVGAAMNEGQEHKVAQPLGSISPGNVLAAKLQPPARPLSYWLRRFLACNPSYLVSAALLLYGFYRVSVDPNFLSSEASQLAFNFTSLQFYEALLVATAIFLARRGIWYDSTLLIGLENLLVLVPFILISQAALIDTRLVSVMCLAGGAIAVARFSSLKRFIAELNLPAGLLKAGLVVLVVNVALPGVYRMLHQHKVGTKPTWGAAYQTNEYTWLLLLPALLALANVLPRTRPTGTLSPQRGWLPLGFFLLWIVGTAVHLYCLGYVYDFGLRPDLLAPTIWVLLWMLYRRAKDLLPEIRSSWHTALLIPPLLTTLVATPQPDKAVFLALTIMNAAIYGSICFHHRDHRAALHLLLISLAALIGGLPEDWGRNLATDFSRWKCIGAAAAGYCLLCAGLSRNPKLGIFGGIVSPSILIAVLDSDANSIHWAVHAGLAFLLMHSLRWEDRAHTGARALRIFAGAVWVAHAAVWLHFTGEGWMICCAIAAPVLVAYLLARWLSGLWGPRVVPIAALLSMLAGPGDLAVARLQATPAGLLAVIGSFLLFGLGTLAALTRQRWQKTDPHALSR